MDKRISVTYRKECKDISTSCDTQAQDFFQPDFKFTQENTMRKKS